MADARPVERSAAEVEARHQDISRWEWLLAAIGALILIGAIGYMSYYGLAFPTTPPQITVEATASEPNGEGFLVNFRAHNGGTSTAAALKITGRLLDGDTVIEESEAHIDYLPQRSERMGGLFFSQNPEDHEMTLRAEGFTKP